MRQLTFKGFLHQYVKELSFSRSNNIRSLVHEVPNGNYRLTEPLVLYALSVNKDDYLRRVAEDSFLLAEAFRFDGMNFEMVELLLETDYSNRDGTIPRNYAKLYDSYVLARDRQQNENHSKMLLRDRINELRREKSISVYRVYTDLKLNHGCIHDYVKNGNVKGVGLNTAKQILDYLLAT